MLASAAASDADVRFAGLSRAIDDAAKYGERKRVMDMLKPLLKRLNSADDIKALSCAAWARHDSYSARANAKRFQDFIADPNFLLRFVGKGDADGVADPGPEQLGAADRTLHRSAEQAPGLGSPQLHPPIHATLKTPKTR